MANKRFANVGVSVTPVEKTTLQDSSEQVTVADSIVEAVFGSTQSLEALFDSLDILGTPGIAYGKNVTAIAKTAVSTLCDGDNLASVMWICAVLKAVTPTGTDPTAAIYLDGGTSATVFLSVVNNVTIFPCGILDAANVVFQTGNSNSCLDVYVMGLK